jgi:protein-S-isoprenylcysteine O-methyltransferase Ste14
MFFLINRTTIIPHRRASTFVQRGPYRWTRNPMYVALTLIYLGICSLTASVWPLLFLPVPLLFLNRLVIPMEERHMEEVFGAQYLAYKTRVRRWL